MGCYLSQDPIGLVGGNPTLYGYVFDTNIGLDVLGLADCLNLGDAGHHVPAIRKSQRRPFELSRSDKTRPTFHFRGADPANSHWRLHNAERSCVGPRQGAFSGSNDELFDAYRTAYSGLDDIKIDVKSPNGRYILGTDVTPQQGVDLVQNWLIEQGLY